MTSLRRAWVNTALGRFLVACSERGVCLVAFGEARAEAQLARWIERHEPGGTVFEDPGAKILPEVARQLVEWSEGRRKRFEVALDLRGTPFQLRCWSELLQIPYGCTRTYGELAARLGHPGASRAVGSANGTNPIPILVPCHRVVARSGLGGFGGGLELKRRMLELEGALLAFA